MAGLSLGSFVIQEAAYIYPSRVEATVHISGGLLYPKFSPFLIGIISFRNLSLLLYPFKPMTKAIAEHKALTKDTKSYRMETISQTGKEIVIHLTNEMVRDMVMGLPEPNPQPALIVYGDHDLKFIKNVAIKWYERQPNSQLVEVHKAHHILNQDNPEVFNELLLDFL